MDGEIVIVSAFFDIGRGNSAIYARSNETYFEYFKFWAGIQNKLIIYCHKEYADKILKIRESFGLQKQTEIVIVENIFNIEAELYQKMSNIENKTDFCNFRYYNEAMSNGAKYDYIMLMKYWCLYDASNRVNDNQKLAWIDFGYNHGGKKYINSNDFHFFWEYDFDNKIHLFCLSNPENMCSIDSLQFQKDCITGNLVVPKEFAKDFWKYIKTAMESLIALDCIDDDQQLLLMVYKLHPELFKVHICDWFDIFLLCSDHHFDLIDNIKPRINAEPAIEQSNGYREKFKLFFSKLKNKFKSLLNRGNKNSTYIPTKKDEFINRTIERVNKYY